MMEQDPQHRRSPFLAIAALALAALAGCEQTPETPAADTAPAARSAAGTAAGAPPADQERISMAECGTPSQGRVHFSLGQTVLAVPADQVRDVIPAGMQAPLQQDAVAEELRAQAAAGAGCPEKPMEAVLLLVGAEGADPLLQGPIGVLRSAPGAITGQFAELTRNLQRNPTQNCRRMEQGELLACIGTETLGQRETPVLYVITTNPARNMNTGGPLAARCVLEGEQVRGCNIVDQLGGDLTIDAALNAGTYTTEGLASAHRAAVAHVQSLRR